MFIKSRNDVLERESGIETLKIIAMIIIVISHVIRTLISGSAAVLVKGYILDVSHSTTNPTHLIISCLSMLGGYGNTIFFMCSAWFLVKSTNLKVKKVFDIITDIWIINFIFLVFFLITGKADLPVKLIIDSLFPTIYAWNWYMTVYIMMYLMHTALNRIIYSLTKKQLLEVNIIMFIMYCVIDYLLGDHFFPNAITYFIILYFFVSYVRLYLPRFCESQKVNTILLLVGAICPFLLTILTNYLGQYIGYFSTIDHYLRWGGMNSPFVIITAISSINLCKKRVFVNKTINYLSGLSMYVYVIHANHLLVDYVYPIVWMWIKTTLGYDKLLVWIIMYAMSLFVISIVVSIVYKITLGRASLRISSFLYRRTATLFDTIVGKLSNIM